MYYILSFNKKGQVCFSPFFYYKFMAKFTARCLKKKGHTEIEIYKFVNEEKLDKLALEYVNKQWCTNYKSINEITDELDLQAIDDFKAGYRKAKIE